MSKLLKKISVLAIGFTIAYIPIIQADDITYQPTYSIGVNESLGTASFHGSVGYLISANDNMIHPSISFNINRFYQSSEIDLNYLRSVTTVDNNKFFIGTGLGYLSERVRWLKYSGNSRYSRYLNSVCINLIFGEICQLSNGKQAFIQTKLSQPFYVDSYKHESRLPALTVSYGIIF